MSKYQSGDLIIDLSFIKRDGMRQYYSFTATIDGEIIDKTNSDNDYSAPIFWNEEQVAQDIVGWMVDTHDGVDNSVEINEEMCDVDQSYLVKLIDK